MIAEKKTQELGDVYHLTSQLVCTLTCPAAGVILFFSRDILVLWSRSVVVAEQSAFILSVLILVVLLYALIIVPQALQFAGKNTHLPFWGTFLGLLAMVPGMISAAHLWGINGPPVVLLIYRGVYFLLIPNLMHRSILPGENWSWYFRDILPFCLAGVAIPALAKYGMELFPAPSILRAVLIFLTLAVSYACAFWIYQPFRSRIKIFFSHR